MNYTKICLISQQSVGVTFVDWSIHFLTGQTKFYQADSDQWIELTGNPLTANNAHNHKKNNPHGYDQVKKVLDKFNQKSNGIFSVYAIIKPLHLISKELNTIPDENNQDLFKNRLRQEYTDMFSLCSQSGARTIYIDSSPEILLYYTNLREGEKIAVDGTLLHSQEELVNKFEEIFFKETVEAYKELNNVWDIREKHAITARPFQSQNIQLDFSLPHLWLDSRTVWMSGESAMRKILDYLDLPLCPDRLNLWLPIYREWQAIQFKNLEFCYNFSHIIDSIVNGWDYKFDDLTFYQEIVIQHYLIYRYGLNLKTWGLVKFPDNAKELHNLLEPSTHNLELLY